MAEESKEETIQQEESEEEIYNHVNEIIQHLRPYIMGDGGDIQLVSVKDGVVTVKMLGACVGCSMIDVTLNQGIKNWIMEEIPSIKEVVMEQESFMDYGFNDYEY